MGDSRWQCLAWLVLLFGLAAWRDVYPSAVGAFLLGLAACAMMAPAIGAWMPLFGSVFICVVSGSPVLYFFVPLFVLPLVLSRAESSVDKWALLCVLSSLPIATLSGGTGGASGWTEWLMANLNWDFSTADAAVWWIRKSIHFLVYGWVAWTAFRMVASVVSSQWTTIAAALAWGCAHAAFDELRQASTPGRSGRWEDFLIDLLGMAVFLAVELWPRRRRP